MTTTRLDLRNSLPCAIVALVVLLLAWPFANLPFNDDWTWAYTVKQLLNTGHLVYNGWSSPPVIAQAYWGLLWVKLFGFSFNVLRVSSLPIAAAAVILCYLLARRAGLGAAFSAFVALSLGLSPLFLPLAATFMTDIPGICFMLLSMYALLRGFETQSRSAAASCLILGAITALIGGSSRQLVWIVPLLILPYFAWLRRKDLTFAALALFGWLIVIAGVMAVQHWYSQQPYALPDPPALSYLRALQLYPHHFALGAICVVLTLVLMLLPAVLGTLRTRWGILEGIAAVLGVMIFILLRHLHHPVPPWMGNIFTSKGVLNSIEVAGNRPIVLAHYPGLALSLLVIGAIALLLAYAILWIVHNSRTCWKQTFDFFLWPPRDHVAIPAMVLLSLALFALEMTRVISDVAYDRHLLPFIPFLAIPLLMVLQNKGQTQMPIWSWALLAVYAAFAVASTQEVNSLARARVAAIQKLEAAGIPANQIEGGFEYDYWTQVEIEGYVNDARIKNPPGAYQRIKGPTPALKPMYRLETGVSSATEPTRFGTVSYFSLLRPFHRTLRIDRFVDPWQLDPAKAATRPAERQLLPQILLDQYNSK